MSVVDIYQTRRSLIADWKNEQTEYEKLSGKLCSCFECFPADGAREIIVKSNKPYPVAFMWVVAVVVAVFAVSVYSQ